jgi:hypothetical protein
LNPNCISSNVEFQNETEILYFFEGKSRNLFAMFGSMLCEKGLKCLKLNNTDKDESDDDTLTHELFLKDVFHRISLCFYINTNTVMPLV